ncbi:MAG: hypothetical protein QN178_04990 [Armatimonadota bacterium]|nr:hypothetical protein [Armatimonadota bacterium]
MSVRVKTFDEFRAAIAAMGLPLTDQELETVWPMVRDLYEQADSLRRTVEELLGPNPLTAAVDRPGGLPGG